MKTQFHDAYAAPGRDELVMSRRISISSLKCSFQHVETVYWLRTSGMRDYIQYWTKVVSWQYLMYVCVCVLCVFIISVISDIDECVSDPCQNNGTCVDLVNEFNCTCVLGFTGTNCETSRSLQRSLNISRYHFSKALWQDDTWLARKGKIFVYFVSS